MLLLELIKVNLFLELIKVNLLSISAANLQMGIRTFEFCHLSQTKYSIVFSQALKMRRICSKRGGPVAYVENLKNWFRERVYPEDMVNKETKRALEIPSLSRPKTSERGVPGNGRIGVPVVFNYNLTRRRS